MNTLNIILNPINIGNVVQLYQDISGTQKNYDEIISEWKKLIEDGGVVITVNAEEFDYPFAFAVLKKEGDSVLIIAKGVKDGFKNQGIEEYLESFIENYIEINNYKLASKYQEQ